MLVVLEMRTLLTLLCTIIACQGLHAHVMPAEFKVSEFKATSDTEAVMTLEVDGTTKTIHIRFRPKHLAVSTTLESHKEALRMLKSQAASGKKVVLDLMSSKGCLPIRGKKGHFRCDGLTINTLKNGEKRVMLIHSDAWAISPD